MPLLLTGRGAESRRVLLLKLAEPRCAGVQQRGCPRQLPALGGLELGRMTRPQAALKRRTTASAWEEEEVVAAVAPA